MIKIILNKNDIEEAVNRLDFKVNWIVQAHIVILTSGCSLISSLHSSGILVLLL